MIQIRYAELQSLSLVQHVIVVEQSEMLSRAREIYMNRNIVGMELSIAGFLWVFQSPNW